MKGKNYIFIEFLIHKSQITQVKYLTLHMGHVFVLFKEFSATLEMKEKHAIQTKLVAEF